MNTTTTTTTTQTTHAAPTFDDLFKAGPDPWNQEHSWYEARKRDLLLAALPQQHYRSAFEPGCASGFLSEHLARRVDRLLAWDTSARAVAYAAERLHTQPHAQAAHGQVPQHWPTGPFDLIVLSEVLYYLPDGDIQQVADQASATLRAFGAHATLVACHWLQPFSGAPAGGAAVHALLHDRLQLPRVAQWRDDDFCLDVWSTETRSLAQQERRRE